MDTCTRCEKEKDVLPLMRGTTPISNDIFISQQGFTQQLEWELNQDYKINWELVKNENICAKCVTDLARVRQEVKNGGIFFRCSTCGIGGAIHVGNFTKSFRKTNALTPTEPAGVVFKKCNDHINNVTLKDVSIDTSKSTGVSNS